MPRPAVSPVIWCGDPRAALAWLDLEDHPWSFGQTLAALGPDERAQATGHDIAISLQGARPWRG